LAASDDFAIALPLPPLGVVAEFALVMVALALELLPVLELIAVMAPWRIEGAAPPVAPPPPPAPAPAAAAALSALATRDSFDEEEDEAAKVATASATLQLRLSSLAASAAAFHYRASKQAELRGRK
jgi:hypothetical protein